MPHQQAVPGAGGVVVVRRVPLDQPVVGGVVDAPEAQGRPQLAALGGVVEHHVEDDLDPGRVQRLDHRLELGHLLAPGTGRGVAVVRGEEADGAVAPVVGQAALPQEPVLGELVHRHQFDGGDAERGQVLDDGRVAHTGVAAADLLRQPRVGPGQPAHMRLVDHRLVVRAVRRGVVAPVEGGVDHHGQHGVPETVGGVPLLRAVEPVPEERRVRVQPAVDGLGVGVQQQFGRVAAVALLRPVGAVHPVAVALSGPDAGQVAVPDEVVDLGQRDQPLRAVVGDQREFDLPGDLGEQREVRARAVVGGSQRIGASGPDLPRGLHPSTLAAASRRSRPPRPRRAFPQHPARFRRPVSSRRR